MVVGPTLDVSSPSEDHLRSRVFPANVPQPSHRRNSRMGFESAKPPVWPRTKADRPSCPHIHKPRPEPDGSLDRSYCCTNRIGRYENHLTQ